ncbi:MAG: 30S ribosomal protein S16, partial [Candidatus Marinimicrobia bacterium]|nr:30S ribosomal protein S16 [Candidatus Neomarinimicrobiota bacterium]
MAVKIRLKRMGRRKRPFYRIVAIDSRTRRDGPEIERLGWFDPLKTDVAIDLKEDRIIHWLEQGAQLSEKVNTIFSSTGLQYKLHLMREGKSEEEIAAALTEWQLGQEEKRARIAEKKLAKKKTKAPVAEEVAEGETPVADESVEEPVAEEIQEAKSDESPEVEEPEEVKGSEEPEVEAEASDDSEKTAEDAPKEKPEEIIASEDSTVEDEVAAVEESTEAEDAPVENEPEEVKG